MPFIEIGILLALVILNGLLAMSELAIVSSRRSKLKAFAEEGRTGAATAVALAAEPGKFLSTVQIGITAVGVVAGAFSGATLGERLARVIEALGVSFAVAEAIGFGIVIAAITYLSLVIGELVPKQIALRNPERVAMFVAPAMALLLRVSAPFVWLLDVSGRFVLRPFRKAGTQEPDVTEEEIKVLIAEAEASGVLEPEEHQMISGVLRLGDRTARSVMTHRNDVEMVDATMPVDEIKKQILETSHGRLPVHQGNPEDVIGVVQSKEMLHTLLEGKPFDVLKMLRTAPIVPDTANALETIRILKNSPVHLGLVHDEYGQFHGIVTNYDILESLTGAYRTDEGPPEPMAVERDDGSWLISGSMPVDEMHDKLGIRNAAASGVNTAAGYVLAALKRLPNVGDSTVIGAWRFEVVDMDGRRIDKLLVQRHREPVRVGRVQRG